MQLPKRFSLTSQRFSKDGTVFRLRMPISFRDAHTVAALCR
jgi:hypothetical protein